MSGEDSRKHVNSNLLFVLYLQTSCPLQVPSITKQDRVPFLPCNLPITTSPIKSEKLCFNCEKVPASKADKLEPKALFVHFSFLWESYL